MDALACQRTMRGPYSVGRFVRQRTSAGPKHGSAWSQIFYRESHPQQDTIRAFAEAFELTGTERQRLAYTYAFDEEPTQ
jgi:hypothetical protein